MMKLSTIEQQVIANMHTLPLDKQQSVLEFSLFLKALSLPPVSEQLPKRQAGLGKGGTWMSEDFDEPLPGSFWLVEE